MNEQHAMLLENSVPRMNTGVLSGDATLSDASVNFGRNICRAEVEDSTTGRFYNPTLLIGQHEVGFTRGLMLNVAKGCVKILPTDTGAYTTLILQSGDVPEVQLGQDIQTLQDRMFSESFGNLKEWVDALDFDVLKVEPIRLGHNTLPIELLSSLRDAFEKLEEDFDIQPRRVIRCNELEKQLSTIEDELENHEFKYLSWFVSTLRDVFVYNDAKQLSHEQLKLLKEGFDVIYENNIKCDKETFGDYYSILVTTDLSLIPTTQKAIDEFED